MRGTRLSQTEQDQRACSLCFALIVCHDVRLSHLPKEQYNRPDGSANDPDERATPIAFCTSDVADMALLPRRTVAWLLRNKTRHLGKSVIHSKVSWLCFHRERLPQIIADVLDYYKVSDAVWERYYNYDDSETEARYKGMHKVMLDREYNRLKVCQSWKRCKQQYNALVEQIRRERAANPGRCCRRAGDPIVDGH